jgi:glycosyltransferase involved in cell wall biosynthesis
VHILLNGTFWAQPLVGSGQYLHGLVRRLPRIAPHHRYTLLLPATHPPGPPPPPGVTTLTLRTPFDGRDKNLAKLWFEQVSIPQVTRLLTDQRDTIVHVPYFAPPLRCGVPVITTVGDIIPLLLPEYRGGPHVRAYMALASHALRHTSHILTFSERSRWDIAAYFDISIQRISAILLAADERYTAQDRAAAAAQVATRYDLHAPFVYYVGGLDARKNVAGLIRACALLRQDQTWSQQPFTLAIAGRPLGGNSRLFPDLDRVIAETGTEECVRRIEVPHADGPLLYRACTIFAFPSRYEGFGLPPLEAMACGAPVVVSNASSLPEVVGEAAVTVPPDDVAGWAAALSRLLGDAALRDELRTRGMQRAGHFSWQRVAEETVQRYESVL